MIASQEYAEHLLALKRAEVASTLERLGYRIETDTRIEDQRADLIASKSGETLLYEFKLPGSLRGSSDEIRRLRRIAGAKGYDFKLL